MGDSEKELKEINLEIMKIDKEIEDLQKEDTEENDSKGS
jgi:hypothetical protein